MNKINRIKFFSAILALAYVLSACSGVPAGVQPQSQMAQQPSSEPQQVVFTGTVQSMGGQWNVSGQPISVDGNTQVDANVAVGSNVRVEAVVDSQGGVKARSIELTVPEATNANSNANTNVNDNSSNANDVNVNTNTNSNTNSNVNDNTNSNTNVNDNGNSNTATATEQEIVGTVESVQNGSITINGVTYSIAAFTEFKDMIAAGDQVKVHVIVNADGTFTIREIEKVTQTTVDNSNSNGSNDNSNINSNTNSDDHGGGGNSNDNNNDDHGDDSGGNSNGGG